MTLSLDTIFPPGSFLSLLPEVDMLERKKQKKPRNTEKKKKGK